MEEAGRAFGVENEHRGIEVQSQTRMALGNPLFRGEGHPAQAFPTRVELESSDQGRQEEEKGQALAEPSGGRGRGRARAHGSSSSKGGNPSVAPDIPDPPGLLPPPGSTTAPWPRATPSPSAGAPGGDAACYGFPVAP